MCSAGRHYIWRLFPETGAAAPSDWKGKRQNSGKNRREINGHTEISAGSSQLQPVLFCGLYR